MMNKALKAELNQRLSNTPPLLRLLASVTGIFLFAFGADVVVQRVVELFLVGIVEQDTFFYSAVRQQDTFAQNILGSIKQFSFIVMGIGFVLTIVVLVILSSRSRAREPFQIKPAGLLQTTLLSLRGIATISFLFLVLTALYALFLRIAGNQPPFFLIAALVIASMYILILAYVLFDFLKVLKNLYRKR